MYVCVQHTTQPAARPTFAFFLRLIPKERKTAYRIYLPLSKKEQEQINFWPFFPIFSLLQLLTSHPLLDKFVFLRRFDRDEVHAAFPAVVSGVEPIPVSVPQLRVVALPREPVQVIAEPGVALSVHSCKKHETAKMNVYQDSLEVDRYRRIGGHFLIRVSQSTFMHI